MLCRLRILLPSGQMLEPGVRYSSDRAFDLADDLRRAGLRVQVIEASGHPIPVTLEFEELRAQCRAAMPDRQLSGG